MVPDFLAVFRHLPFCHFLNAADILEARTETTDCTIHGLKCLWKHS